MYYFLLQTLIMQVGEKEWSKLSEKEKQKRLVELKMKERKLRQEGKNDEAAALYENLVDSDEFGIVVKFKIINIENLHKIYSCHIIDISSICTFI